LISGSQGASGGGGEVPARRRLAHLNRDLSMRCHWHRLIRRPHDLMRTNAWSLSARGIWSAALAN